MNSGSSISRAGTARRRLAAPTLAMLPRGDPSTLSGGADRAGCSLYARGDLAAVDGSG